MAHIAPVDHRDAVNRPGIEFQPLGGQSAGYRSAELFPAPPVGPGDIAFEIGFVQALEPFTVSSGCGAGAGGFGFFGRLLELYLMLHPLDDPLLKIKGRGDLLPIFPANPHGASLDGHDLVNPFHVPILLADLELDHLLSSFYFGLAADPKGPPHFLLKPFPPRIRRVWKPAEWRLSSLDSIA